MSEEKIEVFYLYTGIDSAGNAGGETAGSPREPYYHKYIVYTDSDGNQYAARGGTTLKSGDISTYTVPLGYIDTEVGAYVGKTYDENSNVIDEGFVDYPNDESWRVSEEIIKGADLSSYWNSIEQTMQDIEGAKFHYFPNQNSNSVVDTALANAGLPSTQLDGPSGYNTPGSGRILDPVGHPGVDLPPIPEHKPLPPVIGEDIPDLLNKAHDNSSPLVLDLGSTGIALTSVNGSDAVYWDLDQDGMAEATGWVGPEDGLLAIDINGDGIVTDQSELFGTSTTDGFIILSAYDTNSDGVIDSNDNDFDNLLVWVDANTDGYSQDTELYTLSELNIESIDLSY